MKTTLDKSGIVAELYSKLSYSKKDAQVIVEAILEDIKSKLENGEDVKLSGFGNFCVRSKRSRPGRNPINGESVEITARKVLTFQPSKRLKERVETGQI